MEYAATDAGIASVFFRGGGDPVVNAGFGDGGYVRLTGYRGRRTGNIRYDGGRVYVGVGGGEAADPGVLVLDGETGDHDTFISLGEYYSRLVEPPAFWIDERGLTLAHPGDDEVLLMSRSGDKVFWVNGEGDWIGDRDRDGRSFTRGVVADQFGFSYVCSPGHSARCGVIGPDGRGLFRVILVQLPGLRVDSVHPLIEGRPTDGLYFVTRGGDRPYVFHVPYTIRSGVIMPDTVPVSE